VVVIHLELKETIYIVQEGNVNLLTKLKGILGYRNVKGMEKLHEQMKLPSPSMIQPFCFNISSSCDHIIYVNHIYKKAMTN
jgi:hypothetical protein